MTLILEMANYDVGAYRVCVDTRKINAIIPRQNKKNQNAAIYKDYSEYCIVNRHTLYAQGLRRKNKRYILVITEFLCGTHQQSRAQNYSSSRRRMQSNLQLVVMMARANLKTALPSGNVFPPILMLVLLRVYNSFPLLHERCHTELGKSDLICLVFLQKKSKEIITPFSVYLIGGVVVAREDQSASHSKNMYRLPTAPRRCIPPMPFDV